MTTQNSPGFQFNPFAQFQKKEETPTPVAALAPMPIESGSAQVLGRPPMHVISGDEEMIDADLPPIQHTPIDVKLDDVQATAADTSQTTTEDIGAVDGETEEQKEARLAHSSLNMDQIVTFKDIGLDHAAVFGADINVKWKGSEDVDKVRKAFEAHGIDDRFMPEPPTPSIALKRAVQSVFKGHLFNVSSIGKGAGWSVSVKDTDALAKHLASGLDINAMADASKKAWALKMTCNVVKEGDSTTIRISPPDHPAAENVRQAYAYHSGRVVFSEDISVLFSVKVLSAAHVSGRGQGDTWFVLKGDGLELVRKFSEAVRDVSSYNDDGSLTNGGKITLLPKIAVSGVLESVIDNMIEDADRAIEKMQGDMDKMGERALSSRIGETRKIRANLEQWAKLAGRTLPAVTTRLTEVEKELAVAREQAWTKAEQGA